jgi:formylglycine-generating enzyme required for sulfatase activity
VDEAHGSGGVTTPGESFKDCANCPEMVAVPAGSFMMGSPADEKERYDDEGPQHKVTVSKPFAVGKFVVTFDEWDACVSGGGCKRNPSPGDEGWGKGRRPVINVSWDDAQEYVKWLSQKTRKMYRLLSEAEWEYAARSGTRTRYFWGDSVGRNNANCNGCGSEWDGKMTAEVGQFRPNAFGLYDMAGNVWQRTEDCWNGNYNNAPDDGSALTTGDCSERVLRGGSWANTTRDLRAAARDRFDWLNNRGRYAGFRVARIF